MFKWQEDEIRVAQFHNLKVFKSIILKYFPIVWKFSDLLFENTFQLFEIFQTYCLKILSNCLKVFRNIVWEYFPIVWKFLYLNWKCFLFIESFSNLHWEYFPLVWCLKVFRSLLKVLSVVWKFSHPISVNQIWFRKVSDMLYLFNWNLQLVQVVASIKIIEATQLGLRCV